MKNICKILNFTREKGWSMAYVLKFRVSNNFTCEREGMWTMFRLLVFHERLLNRKFVENVNKSHRCVFVKLVYSHIRCVSKSSHKTYKGGRREHEIGDFC